MKRAQKFGIILFILSGIVIGVVLSLPKKASSANFNNVTVTLGNPRLSYRAGAASGTSGTTLVTIDSSSNPDINTNHLFPKDNVCFSQAALVGCRENQTYAVGSVPSTTTFNTTTSLGSTLDATDIVIASQSGSMAISFTLASEVPSNGDILVTIPKANTGVNDGNDGFPDTGATAAASGFDMNQIVAATDISIATTTSGTCANSDWGTPVLTIGTGSTTDHTIRIDRSTTACQANSTVITVTIDSNPGIVNPAPITSGHIQGQADIYSVNIKTRDGSDNTLDQSDALVAPLEAVLISATVDETLSFRVCGVDTDLTDNAGASCFTGPGTVCGLASLSINSTPYSVPLGTLSTADSFVNAAQYLTAGTNADSGYTVKIQQNDQMGKDGVTCTGNPTDPVTTNCIPDNPGDSTLNFDTSDDCDTASTNGLCFSQDSLTGGTDPTFAVKYNVQTNDCDVSPTFCARSAADQESTETPQNIFSYNNPVSGSDAFVCWRLSIDAIQPAGYYFNKVKYTATPIF